MALAAFQATQDAFGGFLRLLESHIPEARSFAAAALLRKSRTSARALQHSFREELIALLLSRAELLEPQPQRVLFQAAAAAAVSEHCVSGHALETHLATPYIHALAPQSLNAYLGSLGDEFASRLECVNPENGGAVRARMAVTISAVAASGRVPPIELLDTVQRWGAAEMNLNHLVSPFDR